MRADTFAMPFVHRFILEKFPIFFLRQLFSCVNKVYCTESFGMEDLIYIKAVIMGNVW